MKISFYDMRMEREKNEFRIKSNTNSDNSNQNHVYLSCENTFSISLESLNHKQNGDKERL